MISESILIVGFAKEAAQLFDLKAVFGLNICFL